MKKNKKIIHNDWDLDFNCINQEIMLECIELNPPSEIDITYHHIVDSCGYWVIRNLFKNFPLFVKVAKLSPVFQPTNQYGLNCFLKQTLPQVQLENIKRFLVNFTIDYLKTEFSTLTFSDYGNLFKYGKIKTQKVATLPHSDSFLDSNSKVIIASNIWLSKGNNGGTAFWRYKDSYYGNHNYLSYLSSIPNVMQNYDNYDGDEYLEKVGESPAEYGTMTIYNPNLLHSPVVTKDPNHLRWSYALIGMQLID